MLLRKFNIKRMADDAKFVKERARYVLYVDDRAEPLYTEERLGGYSLDILVVIGDVYIDKVGYVPCILLEIGLGRARPYHNAGVPNSMYQEGMGRWLHQRHHFVSLNKPQMDVLWPCIEYALRSKVERQIATWKNGTSWSVISSKRRMSHANNTFTDNNKRLTVDRGLHISINNNDIELIQIALCSEILYYEKFIKKFARYLKICLRNYKQNHYTEKKLRSFCSYPDSGLSALVSTLTNQKIGNHRIAYMVQAGLLGKKQELFLHVLEVFQLVDDIKELSRFNFSNIDSLKFHSDTQVRVQAKRRVNQDYIVVELVPGLGGIK